MVDRRKLLFLLAALAALAAVATITVKRARMPRKVAWPGARVSPLSEPRTGVHAYGRAGDLLLAGSEGTSLVIAAAPDAPGKRPLRGALLDLRVAGVEDSGDPLLWFRVGWRSADGKLHMPAASRVERLECATGSDGLVFDSDVDGVLLRSELCAEAGGLYRLVSGATRLPTGAVLADELHTGTSPPAIEGQGPEWEGEFPTRFVTFAEHGIAVAYEGSPMRALRKRVHIASEVYPTAVTLVHEPGGSVIRTLRIVRGDALDALGALSIATRSFTTGLKDGALGTVTLLDGKGAPLVSGTLGSDGQKALRLPPGFGEACELRDAHGVLGGERVTIADGKTALAPAGKAGSVSLAYVDGEGRALPVHVIVRGVDGTPDPALRPGKRVYAGLQSLYLLDGRADLRLAPGRYSLVATHGLTHTLERSTLTVEAGGTLAVTGTLRSVVDTSAWVSGDFHLHAAPSADSTVSFEERLATLVCQGLDVAVATDHNRIGDYSGAARRLGVTSLGTLVGDEITSYGARLWGHFIAFPLSVPAAGSAPEDVAIPYWDVPPRGLFAGARDAGARVVQVNHARMPPSIGYFDQAHLDPKTGAADPEFSDEFDSMEAFNGVWLEDAERVREGARDLVAMARRGRHPAAMGNSDSHKLHFEEAGFPRTFVHTAREPASSRVERTIDAILAGDTVATSGALIELTVQGKPVGSTVRPDERGKVKLHVRIFAPAWVPVERLEIWMDDEVTERLAIDGPPRDGLRFERDLELTVSRDVTLMAWVDATTPLPPVVPYPNARAIALTGLTYVDADGDNKVQIPPSH
jgi:hypothetical protein